MSHPDPENLIYRLWYTAFDPFCKSEESGPGGESKNDLKDTFTK